MGANSQPAIVQKGISNNITPFRKEKKMNITADIALKMPLCEIALEQDWVDELCKSAGIGGAQKAYKCLRQIVRWAMDKWSLFIPEVTRGIVLTQRRLKRLIRGLVGCPHEATGIIQCALGCRPSENYALRWEQINWRTFIVRINKSLH